MTFDRWFVVLIALVVASPCAAGPVFIDPTDIFASGERGETHVGDFLQYAGAACDTGHRHLQFAASWTGTCRDGRPDGPGTLRITLGPSENIRNTATITGGFVNGLLDGEAVVTFEDGPHASFNGIFHNGAPNGDGVLVERDGTRFAGAYMYDALGEPLTADYPDGAHLAFGNPGGPMFRYADGTVVTRGGKYALVLRLAGGSKLVIERASPYVWGLYCSPTGRRNIGAFYPAWPIDAPQPYPGLSQRLNEQGTVWVSLEVLADGRTDHVALHRSSGHERLDNAALAAVNGWRFRPAMVGDYPIATPVIVSLTYDFRPTFEPPNTEYFGPWADPSPPKNWHLNDCRRW